MSGFALNAAGWGPGAVALAALVALVGALAIHALGRRRTRAVAADPGARALLRELARALPGAAARMDVPQRLLPRISPPTPVDGDYLFAEGAELVYATVERGTRMSEHRAASVDDMLYRVLRDRAWMQTYLRLMEQNLSPADHAAQLREGQRALLHRGNPAWADRLAQEAEA